MELESNPVGFIEDEQDQKKVETSSGVAGRELLDTQWGLMEITKAEYARSKTANTPGISFTIKLDDKLALTPKRTKRFDWWLTPGMQPQIDGFFLACGLGVLSHKIGVRYNKKTKEEIVDLRPQVEDIDLAGKAWAAALNNRKFIGCIGIEVDKEEAYEDKNKLTGYHKITDENLAALSESGFGAKSITVKKTRDGKTYLAAKKGGAKTNAASGSAGVLSV